MPLVEATNLSSRSQCSQVTKQIEKNTLKYSVTLKTDGSTTRATISLFIFRQQYDTISNLKYYKKFNFFAILN